MSNRERWIVYPLLFYALVMGFKSTYRDPMEFRCHTIDCRNLNVELINGSAALANPASRTPTNVIVVRGGEELTPSNGSTGPVESAEGPAEGEEGLAEGTPPSEPAEPSPSAAGADPTPPDSPSPITAPSP